MDGHAGRGALWRHGPRRAAPPDRGDLDRADENDRPRPVGLPTPCSEWSVRDLANHVVGEDAWTVPLMRGSTLEEVGDTLDGDLLGDEPVAAALRSADQAVAVVAETLPAGGTVHLSYGVESKEELRPPAGADHLVHAWDLAAAIGGDRHLDEALLEEVATWFAGREEMYRSGGAIGPRVRRPGRPADQPAGRCREGCGMDTEAALTAFSAAFRLR